MVAVVVVVAAAAVAAAAATAVTRPRGWASGQRPTGWQCAVDGTAAPDVPGRRMSPGTPRNNTKNTSTGQRMIYQDDDPRLTARPPTTHTWRARPMPCDATPQAHTLHAYVTTNPTANPTANPTMNPTAHALCHSTCRPRATAYVSRTCGRRLISSRSTPSERSASS